MNTLRETGYLKIALVGLEAALGSPAPAAPTAAAPALAPVTGADG